MPSCGYTYNPFVSPTVLNINTSYNRMIVIYEYIVNPENTTVFSAVDCITVLIVQNYSDIER